jgi:hypothetical protein
MTVAPHASSDSPLGPTLARRRLFVTALIKRGFGRFQETSYGEATRGR